MLPAFVRRLMALRLVRFLFVGVLNTLFGYAIYLTLVWFGLGPSAALAIATIIGAVFNYFSTGRLVFASSGMNKLPLFLGAYLVIYLANVAALQGLIGAGIPAQWAQGILLPVVAIASFLIFKFVVFRPGTH